MSEFNHVLNEQFVLFNQRGQCWLHLKNGSLIPTQNRNEALAMTSAEWHALIAHDAVFKIYELTPARSF